MKTTNLLTNGAQSLPIASIYMLIDPQTNQARYVGKTNRSLHTRLKAHLTRARNQPGCNKVSSWIASLLQNGVVPEIVCVDQVQLNKWQETEQFWIAYLRSLGACLTNMTEGGAATHGHKLSIEARRKVSAAAKKQFESDAAREISRQAAKDAWTDPCYRERVSSKLRKIHASPEYRRKQSESRIKLAESEEYRAKLRAAQAKVDRTTIAKEFWGRPEYQARQQQSRAARRAKKIADMPLPLFDWRSAEAD